jgi:hypothetical protein
MFPSLFKIISHTIYVVIVTAVAMIGHIMTVIWAIIWTRIISSITTVRDLGPRIELCLLGTQRTRNSTLAVRTNIVHELLMAHKDMGVYDILHAIKAKFSSSRYDMKFQNFLLQRKNAQIIRDPSKSQKILLLFATVRRFAIANGLDFESLGLEVILHFQNNLGESPIALQIQSYCATIRKSGKTKEDFKYEDIIPELEDNINSMNLEESYDTAISFKAAEAQSLLP